MQATRTWGAGLSALVLVVSSAMLATPGYATGNGGVDTTGLPDLIVDQQRLQDQWVVREEKFAPTLCSVIEGGVVPGVRKVLRFTASTPNIGDADLVIGDPNLRPDLFDAANCHRHFHFKNFTEYQLIDPRTGKVWIDAKNGFCMIDVSPVPGLLRGPNPGADPPGKWNFRVCGRPAAPGLPAIAGNQGISHGWEDVYFFLLGGQYFVLDGGQTGPAHQDPVPTGTYILRIIVNPGYAPDSTGKCRVSDRLGEIFEIVDGTKICHNFRESRYDNNTANATVVITDHPGHQGVGPLAGTPHVEDLADEPTDGD